ncbi:MAG: hypothetical protein ABSG01_01315 [Anaerolineales bacterium]
MKPTRRLSRITTFIILIVSIVLVAAITGFRLPVVLASTSMSVNPAAQLSLIAPTAASVSPKTPIDTTHAISWPEVVTFLENDHTNWNPYIPGKYTCLDFSTDLVANATQQGIKAWIVAVDFTGGGAGHAFVVFETTDRGIVYVEPQADDTYPTVAVGKNLCVSWGVYQCMGTVSSIQFIQCDKAHFCTKYTP